MSHQASTTRASRIKRARELAGYSSTRAFCEKHPNISPGTLRSWESESYKALTPKSAAKLSQALQQDGVIVSVEWLLEGVGPEPRNVKNTSSEESVIDRLTIYRPMYIHEELTSFRSASPSAIYTQIQDEAMEPKFAFGDYVCGFWLPEADLYTLLGRPCIVKTKSNELICRLLVEEDGRFKTQNLNQASTLPEKIVEKAAAVSKVIFDRKSILS